MALQDLDEYAETLLAREISTIDGVAQVRCSARANMACASRSIPTRWRRARSASTSLPAHCRQRQCQQSHRVGEWRPPGGIHPGHGQLNNAADFRNQVIAYRNGAPVRLGDVATVLDGQESYLGGTWLHEKKGVALAITRQPGSNTVEVIEKIKAILPHFEAGLPKGVQLKILYDQSDVINASVNDVQITLLIAGLLVVGVIFVFLRRLSATIIPVAGAAHRGDRHLRRHGGDGLQSRQSVADGADPVGGLCGR